MMETWYLHGSYMVGTMSTMLAAHPSMLWPALCAHERSTRASGACFLDCVEHMSSQAGCRVQSLSWWQDPQQGHTLAATLSVLWHLTS